MFALNQCAFEEHNLHTQTGCCHVIYLEVLVWKNTSQMILSFGLSALTNQISFGSIFVDRNASHDVEK